jgi:hypothetical protein
MKPYRHLTLSASEQAAVELGYKSGVKHHYRERCQAVLLNAQGHTIPSISVLLGKRRETSGIDGLKIKAGRGLKAILNPCLAELVTEIKKK